MTSLFLNIKSLNTIINVTSGLAFVQLSKVPVYCATKGIFHSFTLLLRQQLKAKNIEVIEIIPPALNTDLGGKGLHDGQPAVKDFVDAVFEQIFYKGKVYSLLDLVMKCIKQRLILSKQLLIK